MGTNFKKENYKMRQLLFAFIFLFSTSIISCSTGDDTQMYEVSVSTSPSDAGTVFPADTSAEEGEQFDLQAGPAEGYLFSHWSGDVDSTSDNPITLTVDQDYNLTANFTLKTYELTLNTDGEGTVEEEVLEEKSKEYEHGTVVELTANSAEGYKFLEWNGDLESTNNPVQITVDETKEVTAVFEKKSYELTVNTTGEGAVSEEIVQEKSTDYEYGTVVELTANSAEGWKFIEWQGDITGTENPEQITVDEPKEVTAIFEKKSYSLTMNIDGEGTVAKDPDQTEYIYNNSVELTATPSEGWKFVEWSGDISSANNPISITIDTNKTVTAIFERKSYELTINSDGEGEVSEDIISGSSTTDGYLYESEVKLTANPNAGWSFVKWSRDITGTEMSNYIVIDKDKAVSAKFAETPSSVINEVSKIYADSATVFGEITNEGNADLKEKGVCYSTSELPTLDDNCAKVESDGSIEYRLEGLSPSTTYYVRIYGTNIAGTGYSEQNVFDSKYFNPGSGVTDIDGNNYETVIIGDQEWTRENLRVIRYQNGDSIPHLVEDSEWSSTTSGAYSFFDNDESRNVPNGKLYNWFATTDSRGLCPQGWKVPTRTDWNELIWFLGGENIAGERMKFPGDWSTQTSDTVSVSGFQGLKNGHRSYNGSFNSSATVVGSWWSSIEVDEGYARFFYIYYANSKAQRDSDRKGAGRPIRCVRNLR